VQAPDVAAGLLQHPWRWYLNWERKGKMVFCQVKIIIFLAHASWSMGRSCNCRIVWHSWLVHRIFNACGEIIEHAIVRSSIRPYWLDWTVNTGIVTITHQWTFFLWRRLVQFLERATICCMKW
jgi:hypothetical protein